jgi:cullin-5
LKYVENKDVFMRFYKGSLTRRLILDISIDNELEESIVIQLRVSKRKTRKDLYS